MEEALLGTTAEYIRPSEAVRTEEADGLSRGWLGGTSGALVLRTRKMLATHGTIDSARSSRAHHRPLIDLNDHDECCIGPKWRVHAHTHENASCAWFDHSHTRPKACRAPFGWGSNRQAKRRANHLGQTRELLAQETEHIGGRRQTGILTRYSL